MLAWFVDQAVIQGLGGSHIVTKRQNLNHKEAQHKETHRKTKAGVIEEHSMGRGQMLLVSD